LTLTGCVSGQACRRPSVMVEATMSMWRIGREAVAADLLPRTPLDRAVAGGQVAGGSVAGTAVASGAGVSGSGSGQPAGGAGSGPISDIADTVAKWVPGEVLALYGVGVSLIGSPNWFWLLVGVLMAPAVVLLAAFVNSGAFPPGPATAVRAALGLSAMLIWTLTVPGSGWREWALLRDNATVLALAGAVLGVFFGLVAEGVSRWADNRPPRPPVRGASPPSPGPSEPGRAAPSLFEPGLRQAGPPPSGLEEPTTELAQPPRGGEHQMRLPSVPRLD
jgi:hypothetical protein